MAKQTHALVFCARVLLGNIWRKILSGFWNAYCCISLGTNALDTYARASRISNKGWAGNVFEVQCCMDRHLPVQEEVDWLRLLLFENEGRNIAKTVT